MSVWCSRLQWMPICRIMYKASAVDLVSFVGRIQTRAWAGNIKPMTYTCNRLHIIRVLLLELKSYDTSMCCGDTANCSARFHAPFAAFFLICAFNMVTLLRKFQYSFFMIPNKALIGFSAVFISTILVFTLFFWNAIATLLLLLVLLK